MGKSRFTEEKMVAVLRDADRTSVAESAKKHQVSDANGMISEAFDVEAWLVKWIERPQPALGRRSAAAFLRKAGDLDVVIRLLGAISSGSYL